MKKSIIGIISLLILIGGFYMFESKKEITADEVKDVLCGWNN